MATNSVGRIIYGSLEITGAVLCLLMALSLIKRLYFGQSSSSNSSAKQVMEPTVRMKICSISCGMILCIGLIMKSLILSSVINGDNVHNHLILVLGHLGALLMDAGQALYFKYFVLSIRKLYRSNDIARNAISKPILICTEILIIFNISISIIYTLCILSIYYSTKINSSTKNVVAIIYTICHLTVSLLIDIGLIYLYKSIIYNYASNWRFNDNGLVNDQHHLLLILMTRYCSLIFLSASIDVIKEIYTIFEIFIGNDYFSKQQQVWIIFAGTFEFIDVTIYVIAIYFSFSINNLIYERYCFCCHNAIYDAAHSLIAQKHQSSDYVMMSDHHDNDKNINNHNIYNDNDMIDRNESNYSYHSYHSHLVSKEDEMVNSLHSNYSNSSQRRETNYFDDNYYLNKKSDDGKDTSDLIL